MEFDKTQTFRNLARSFAGESQAGLRYQFISKLALKQGYKVEEIPVVMRERQGGVSSITMKKSVYYMIKVSLAILMEALRGKDRK